jgi:hypothetical protein
VIASSFSTSPEAAHCVLCEYIVGDLAKSVVGVDIVTSDLRHRFVW